MKRQEIFHMTRPHSERLNSMKPSISYSALAEERTSISHSGKTPAIWSGKDKLTQYEIKTAMQALMINMKKHSSGTRVNWGFERAGNLIQVLYNDLGTRIKKDQREYQYRFNDYLK